MNEKIISLLLVCLLALSSVYACASSLSGHAIPSVASVGSESSTVIEKPCQNAKVSIQGMFHRIMGDPIDDPTPN